MSLVKIDRRVGGVVTLRLNDPARRNAMTEEMGEELGAAVTALQEDDEVRCVVLAGEGRAFCAGGDLDSMDRYRRLAVEDARAAVPALHGFYDLFLVVRSVPVPTVAAVHGAAIGAGLCLAMACDLTIVAEDARLGVNFARIGIYPGMAATALLPARVGRQRALELLLTGRLFSGADAREYGLAIEAVAEERVLPRAQELAAQVAVSAPGVVRDLLESTGPCGRMPLHETLRDEARFQARSYMRGDVLEGVAAVRERRPPTFT